MELYKEILIKVLENEKIQVSFPTLTVSATEIVENVCYKALCEIKSIIENDTLSDEECFMRIEEIVNVFESLGSNGGNRHDF